MRILLLFISLFTAYLHGQYVPYITPEQYGAVGNGVTRFINPSSVTPTNTNISTNNLY